MSTLRDLLNGTSHAPWSLRETRGWDVIDAEGNVVARDVCLPDGKLIVRVHELAEVNARMTWALRTIAGENGLPPDAPMDLPMTVLAAQLATAGCEGWQALLPRHDALKAAIRAFFAALDAYEIANNSYQIRSPHCTEADGTELRIACLTAAGALDIAKTTVNEAMGDKTPAAVNDPTAEDVPVPEPVTPMTFEDVFRLAVARYGKPSLRDVSAGFAFWPRLPRSTEAGCELDGVSVSDEDDEGVVIVATGHGASHVCNDHGEDALDDAHRWLVAHGGPMRPEAS